MLTWKHRMAREYVRWLRQCRKWGFEPSRDVKDWTLARIKEEVKLDQEWAINLEDLK